MDRKRPQGREKHVTESDKGVHKRGEGLNTGPVGSGSAFSDQKSASGQRGSAGQPSSPGQTTSGRTGAPGQTTSGRTGFPGQSTSGRTGTSGQSGFGQTGSGRSQQTRSGGKSSLLLIIIALVVLLGGGGGALSGLLGGDGGGVLSGLLDGSSDVSGIVSSYSQGTTAQTTPTPRPAAPTPTPRPASSGQTGSTAVVTRDRYTTIQGGGRDTVTILIYMCGTDLESGNSMASRDLAEMAAASWGDNMHVIVYTGGCTQWHSGNISSSTNQIYEVVKGGIRSLNSNVGQYAMTNPSTLSSFIRWGAENFPANRYALILWDHGGGSVSGYGYDEKFKSSGSMSLAGVSQALADGGVKFDFVGFDACLMATLETGLMLDDYADYLIASEETEPGIGWYYTDWLNSLGANTSLSTVEVGKQIVDTFVTTCARSCPGQSATLSVVDLAELSATTPASLRNFSQSISALITDNQYQQISSARNSTREFARSSGIDQIDLVDFAVRLGTGEAQQLAGDLQSAVKYNRTTSNMTNCYGLSIYFPYRKTSTVNSAISTYNAIGLDESYSQAIREFAGLEVSGQAASYGGYSSAGSPVTSLLEALMGGSPYSSGSGSYGTTDMITSLLGAFMGGSGADFFSGRSMSVDDTVAYIENNFFDASALQWTRSAAGDTVIALADDQWDLILDVDLNMYYDDGEGYIDLGLDNVYDFDDDGNLLAPADRTWVAVNGQPVAYYHEYTSDTEIRGYIPVMLNGRRAELLVVFDDENPYGAVTGARYVYVDGETDTVAKNLEALTEGDTLDFLCDYYTYDGEYSNTHYLGETMTVSGPLEISNVDVGEGTVLMLYRFTDLYQQHYWTPALEG